MQLATPETTHLLWTPNYKVGRGAALQAGSSRVKFPMGQLGFSGSNRNEYLGYALRVEAFGA
jgi:hypothetical protein